ncbi:MAG: VWA domain-containing protein, partial [Terracidiphilus sp.]
MIDLIAGTGLARDCLSSCDGRLDRGFRMVRHFLPLMVFVLTPPSMARTSMPHLPQDAVPQENEAPVIKVQTVNVIVDVAVTDRDGNPVQGLNEQDFLLFENGEPQHIAFFEEHTGARSVQGKTPVLPPNVFTNIPRQASPDATVVLLLDSLNTQLQDQVFVRSQILEFLKHPLQGRRIAIFTLSDKLRMIQD